MNTALRKVGIVVEQVFGDITNFFKFLDSKKYSSSRPVTDWKNVYRV